jgi:hypothetical protein
MHITIKVTVTQAGKVCGKKSFFFVIENTSAFCVLCSLLAYGLGMEENEWKENEKRKKRKEQTKWYPPFFPPKCLQFGMDASHGPKQWERKKAMKHESRKARLAQEQPPSSSNFFSSLWVFC